MLNQNNPWLREEFRQRLENMAATLQVSCRLGLPRARSKNLKPLDLKPLDEAIASQPYSAKGKGISQNAAHSPGAAQIKEERKDVILREFQEEIQRLKGQLAAGACGSRCSSGAELAAMQNVLSPTGSSPEPEEESPKRLIIMFVSAAPTSAHILRPRARRPVGKLPSMGTTRPNCTPRSPKPSPKLATSSDDAGSFVSSSSRSPASSFRPGSSAPSTASPKISLQSPASSFSSSLRSPESRESRLAVTAAASAATPAAGSFSLGAGAGAPAASPLGGARATPAAAGSFRLGAERTRRRKL